MFEYKKELKFDGNKVKTFELKRKFNAAVIQVYEGVIIRAGDMGSSGWHDLVQTSPNWDKASDILLEFYHYYKSTFRIIHGMLNENTKEYKKLKESMKKAIRKEIHNLECKIKEYEDLSKSL